MKKIGWLMLYVFLIKAIQAIEFWKISGFFGQVFPQKDTGFQWKQIKIKYSINFCFASFDSLKAVTAYF